jgi:glucose-6-phosphate-specific signal transduction histidine kinase
MIWQLIRGESLAVSLPGTYSGSIQRRGSGTMQKQGSWWRERSPHVAVALAYALVFLALREVSFSHWVLFAGLRFCVLLLAPYKYWPALFIGELGPAALTSFSCLDTYGLAWSMLAAFPPIILAAPVVRWGRERLVILPRTGSVSIRPLLLCTLFAAVLWSFFNLAVLSLARLPADAAPLVYPAILGRWFVGNFLGVLTVAPLVLSVRELVQRKPGRAAVRSFLQGGSLGACAMVLGSLVALVLVGRFASSESLRQSARMAMFLPVVWLAMKHGWHGAAIGGTLASIGVVATMPAIADPDTMQAQVFIAFAITTMLLLGERIASLDSIGRREKEELHSAMVLAQKNMFMGELHLRQTSEALEHVREAVQGTYGQLLARLQYLLPDQDDRDCRKKVAVTQQQLFRLADSLNPVVRRASGLAAALRQGAIARAMSESGVAYWCDIRERSLEDVSDALSISAYRLVCDVMFELCCERPVSAVSVALRAGVSRAGQRWVAIAVTASFGGKAVPLPRSELALWLPSSGLGIDAVMDRVSTFSGRVKFREGVERRRISMIIRDPQP